MDMVERVARALHAQWLETYDGPKDGTPYDNLSEQSKEYGFGLGRAAIAAMREPTEAILDAGWYTDCLQAGPNDSATIVWKAMIDAALECSIKPDVK